ncbi:MAG: glycosyltransferase [Bifidobacterium tibiigranuli]|nr:glycosyltransferase [Bifidobacterium tibiigranuli]
MSVMDNDQVVSVIIPVYKVSSETMARCLNSIRGQHSIRLQVIAVLDGEQDDSNFVNSSFFTAYPEVTVLLQEHSGVARARNTGIKHALGSWIAFVDADDCLPRGALENLISFATAQNSDIVFSNHERLYGKKSMSIDYFKRDVSSGERNTVEWLGDVISSGSDQGVVWGKLFSTSFLHERDLFFRCELKNGEDQEFVIRCVEETERISALCMKTYIYVYNSVSVTRKYDSDYIDNTVLTLNAVKDDFTKAGLYDSLYLKYLGFVLDRLLQIIVNGIFNPLSTLTRHEKFDLLKQVSSEKDFQDALRSSELFTFSLGKRFTLLCVRYNLFLIVYIISAIRNWELRANS